MTNALTTLHFERDLKSMKEKEQAEAIENIKNIFNLCDYIENVEIKESEEPIYRAEFICFGQSMEFNILYRNASNMKIIYDGEVEICDLDIEGVYYWIMCELGSILENQLHLTPVGAVLEDIKMALDMPGTGSYIKWADFLRKFYESNKGLSQLKIKNHCNDCNFWKPAEYHEKTCNPICHNTLSEWYTYPTQVNFVCACHELIDNKEQQCLSQLNL